MLASPRFISIGSETPPALSSNTSSNCACTVINWSNSTGGGGPLLVSTRWTGQNGKFKSDAPGIRQTGDNDAYIVLVTRVLKITPSPKSSQIARRYEIGVFNTRRAPPTTSRIQIAMTPTCSRKTSKISCNEFDESFVDNVGLD